MPWARSEDRESYDYVRGGGLLQTLFKIRGGRTLITRYTYQTTDTFPASPAATQGQKTRAFPGFAIVIGFDQ